MGASARAASHLADSLGVCGHLPHPDGHPISGVAPCVPGPRRGAPSTAAPRGSGIGIACAGGTPKSMVWPLAQLEFVGAGPGRPGGPAAVACAARASSRRDAASAVSRRSPPPSRGRPGAPSGQALAAAALSEVRASSQPPRTTCSPAQRPKAPGPARPAGHPAAAIVVAPSSTLTTSTSTPIAFSPTPVASPTPATARPELEGVIGAARRRNRTPSSQPRDSLAEPSAGPRGRARAQEPPAMRRQA